MTYLFLAAAIICLGIAPITRIRTTSPTAPRDGPTTTKPHELDLASDLELLAVALESGLPTASAIKAVAEASGASTHTQWQRISGLIGIGVSPAQAFHDCHHLEGFDQLSRLIARSYSNGHAIADGCRDIATALRDGAADAAIARAERAGVLITLPLTGCFLPAFLILGLAPVIYSMATQHF